MHKSINLVSFRHDACPILRIPNSNVSIDQRVIQHNNEEHVPQCSTIGADGDTNNSENDDHPVVNPSLEDIPEAPDSPPFVASEVRIPPPPVITKNTSLPVKCSSTECRNLVRKLKRKLRMALNKNSSLVSFNERLKKRMRELKARAKSVICKRCEEYKDLPVEIKCFFDEQIMAQNKSRRGIRWSESTIKICQTILYKSPTTYLRLQTFFALPSRSTLQRRQSISSKAVRLDIDV